MFCCILALSLYLNKLLLLIDIIARLQKRESEDNMTASLQVFESVLAFSVGGSFLYNHEKKSPLCRKRTLLYAHGLAHTSGTSGFYFFPAFDTSSIEPPILDGIGHDRDGHLIYVCRLARGEKVCDLIGQKIGALMLTSSFGSTALIGYPLIQFSFSE